MKIKYFLVLTLSFIIISYNLFSEWEKTALPMNSVNTLCVFNNKLYAGTNENGIFLSGNQGSSWNESNTNLTNKYIWAIVGSGTSLFCGTEGGGVFLSVTSGNTWKPANDGIGNLSIFNLGIFGTNLFAITDNSGVYRSTLGTNWENVNDGMITKNMYAIAMNESKVFIGGENGDLYMSTNNGNSWSGINPGDIKATINAILIKQNKIFVGTSFGVFVSENQGASWNHASYGLSNTDVTSLAMKDNSVLIAGTRGGGIFISGNDGLTWRSLNEGLDNLTIQCLTLDTKYLYAGTSNSVSRRLLSEIKIPEILPPVLQSPTNNSSDVPIEVTFSWNASSGAVSYHLQVAKDELMQNIIDDTDNLTNLSYTLTLDYLTTYYWRVASNTDNSEKKWSEKWSFTTIQGFGPPELSFPEDKAKDVLVLTDFSWKPVPEAVSYKLKIAEDIELKIGVILIEDILTNSYTLTQPLKGYTTYYWSAAATDKNSNTFWSNFIWEFETGEPSGINDDFDNIKSIKLYPNPATENIILLTPKGIIIKNICLLDIFGNKVQNFSISNNQKDEILKLDIKSISTGQYMLHLFTQGNTIITLPVTIIK